MFLTILNPHYDYVYAKLTLLKHKIFLWFFFFFFQLPLLSLLICFQLCFLCLWIYEPKWNRKMHSNHKHCKKNITSPLFHHFIAFYYIWLSHFFPRLVCFFHLFLKISMEKWYGSKRTTRLLLLLLLLLYCYLAISIEWNRNRQKIIIRTKLWFLGVQKPILDNVAFFLDSYIWFIFSSLYNFDICRRRQSTRQ